MFLDKISIGKLFFASFCKLVPIFVNFPSFYMSRDFCGKIANFSTKRVKSSLINVSMITSARGLSFSAT